MGHPWDTPEVDKAVRASAGRRPLLDKGNAPHSHAVAEAMPRANGAAKIAGMGACAS